MILLAIIVSTLLWADLTNGYLWVALLRHDRLRRDRLLRRLPQGDQALAKGVPGKGELLVEIAIAALAALGVDADDPHAARHHLTRAVLQDGADPSRLVLHAGRRLRHRSAPRNAVNLTDGLDGLAIVPAMIAAGCFVLIAYLVGNVVFANYLQIQHVAGAGELAVFCAAMVGAGLGFLWFNAPPAMVFMGDTGSLSIGAALGIVAVVTKHELVLAIIGGLFVLETVSVIVQVASFKLTGKRVFRMAPLHHHFEKKGWPEPTIVIRFWIIACDPRDRRPLDLEAQVDAMIAVSSLHERVAILGLARSGLAAAQALQRGGANVMAWDDARSRAAKPPKPPA